MNFDAYKREAVIHYAELAREPAWKAYVWQEAQDFAKRFPLQFGDLPDLLTAEMNKRKETK